MKIITYSQVPQKNTYIHLAYLSAAGMTLDSPFGSGVLMGIVLVVVYLIGSALKVNVTYPRAWRLLIVSLFAAFLILLLLSFAAVNTLSSHTLRGS